MRVMQAKDEDSEEESCHRQLCAAGARVLKRPKTQPDVHFKEVQPCPVRILRLLLLLQKWWTVSFRTRTRYSGTTM